MDVFAEEKYAGNQLAVFTEGHLFSDEEMQLLAKEMNYSETTFIFPEESSGNTFKVRIFTPEKEVPFAGHPTLGTAYIIQRELLQGKPEEIILDLQVGKIPVTLTYGPDGKVEGLTMRQVNPTFGQVVEKEAIAQVLSLELTEIDERYPVQEVSTGLPFLIVPLKQLAAVQKAKVNVEALMKLTEALEAKAVFIFSPETYETGNQLNSRMFGHCYGIVEDPATGSANGCLAGYLLKYGYFGEGSLNIKVEQGYEIGRKSLLYLSGFREGEEYRILVGGQVQAVAKGELLGK
ncbi:MAG: PhzF family phenazine biosynthesis protein [Clostridia bacterium]|nr:PhzF family phenazine biosynthesis protein [Clostridia bacterium]